VRGLAARAILALGRPAISFFIQTI
jgi:hypothetical protein